MSTTLNNENEMWINKLLELLLDENIGLRHAMKRIESLLKHSVELMNESVATAHSTIHSHQIILDKAVNTNSQDQESGNELLTTLRKALGITIQLNAILSKTTRSLQVEDIVSQIVNNVSKRTIQMDNILTNLQELKNNALAPDMIKKMQKEMEDLHRTVQKNPIRQSSLDEGEIELF